jgi:DNA-binding IclR family transcriptional regulator
MSRVGVEVIALHKNGCSLTEIASATGTQRSMVQRVLAKGS